MIKIILIILIIFILLRCSCSCNKISDKIIENYTLPFPIDLIIAWAGENEGTNDYLSRANRDEGILKYSLRSIIKNLPWIRHIYLFKDPPTTYPSWLDKKKWYPKIQVIDRCQYFNNKNWCPTKNSSAVYLNMYKIKGLSEHFLYMDDDTIIFKKLKYTDFFTNDGKKIISSISKNTRTKQIYSEEKVKKGNVKPPKSPLQFSSGDDHIMIPHLKSIYKDLNKKYSKWFDFVSSHKKRWCCCDDSICPNPKDDCKACYDELGGNLIIPHLEAYKRNKAIYNQNKLLLERHVNHEKMLNALKKIKHDGKITFFNINNIDHEETLLRENSKKYEKRKKEILNELERLFPDNK